jgi:hypothetical protein
VPADAPAEAAPAKEPDQATKNAARTAYAQGEKTYRAGQFDKAYDHFAKANELIPTIHAVYWMAMSLVGAGKKVAAYDALVALLEDPSTDKLGSDKVDSAKAELTKLEKEPATVTISTMPLDAVVTVDGAAHPGQSPHALDVIAGTHEVTVTAVGFEPITVQLKLKPGDNEGRTVELAALPPPPPPAPAPVAAPPPKPEPAPAPPPPPKERSLVPAYVTLGIAGASAIVGTIFGIQALGAKSDFDDDPTAGNADDAERNALIADMAFGVTVTLGITGIVLLTSDEETKDEISRVEPSRPLKRARAGVQVTPYAGPKGGGAAARVTF